MMTATLFDLLDRNGPMRTEDLARAAGITTRQVWGLLKGPMYSERVFRYDGLFCLNRASDHGKVRASIAWTKCSDVLPDDDESVLLACEDGEVQVGFRDAGVWRYLNFDPIQRCAVTHWAELPDHPEQT